MIIRASAKEPVSDIYSAIRPTNSYDTCRLILMRAGRAERACRWWNPTADDLMADDWIVIREKGDGTEEYPYAEIRVEVDI